MSQPDGKPAQGKKSFYCPHCGVLAQQSDSRLVKEGTGTVLTSRSRRDPRSIAQWSFSRCGVCENIAVWHDNQMIYPTASTLPGPHEDMPPEALQLYSEAAAVFPHSRRAAAALARGALERLLRHAGVEGRDLSELIVNTESEVPWALFQLLTSLRVLGNSTLHDEQGAPELVAVYLDEDDAEIAETIITVVNEACEALIAVPKRAERIYNAIPKAKRDYVEGQVDGVRKLAAAAAEHAEPEASAS
ncbi:DUF4145 domain-containing protein [Agrococcus sp. SL85]|uniref:DUF4145 domain-containing protein n=1 Tax=Agrococcus sp. SL85 TaxID=2995141 RepID=UPI00226CE729|nr:DUF4145 domain-containing protein [Agrococcus sp. SL85]WAC65762.1 DUF4145 domain-containing protein [Agrococcus sp. SL85]